MEQAGLWRATYDRYMDWLNEAGYTYTHTWGVKEKDVECNVARVRLDKPDSAALISTAAFLFCFWDTTPGTRRAWKQGTLRIKDNQYT